MVSRIYLKLVVSQRYNILDTRILQVFLSFQKRMNLPLGIVFTDVLVLRPGRYYRDLFKKWNESGHELFGRVLNPALPRIRYNISPRIIYTHLENFIGDHF